MLKKITENRVKLKLKHYEIITACKNTEQFPEPIKPLQFWRGDGTFRKLLLEKNRKSE